MTLPYALEKLIELNLTRFQLQEALIERRNVIGYHRDQKGDDRCWLDDHLVHEMLGDTPALKVPQTFEGRMAKCEQFYLLRSVPDADKQEFDIWRWWYKHNWDLYFKSRRTLFYELFRLQAAIVKHRDTKRPRTVSDDRELYAAIPGKMVADFRLPPEHEFLGMAKAPNAGCPAFWNSHRDCREKCNFHQWGPCK